MAILLPRVGAAEPVGRPGSPLCSTIVGCSLSRPQRGGPSAPPPRGGPIFAKKIISMPSYDLFGALRGRHSSGPHASKVCTLPYIRHRGVGYGRMPEVASTVPPGSARGHREVANSTGRVANSTGRVPEFVRASFCLAPTGGAKKSTMKMQKGRRPAGRPARGARGPVGSLWGPSRIHMDCNFLVTARAAWGNRSSDLGDGPMI